MRIYYSSKFEREYKGLPKEIKKIAEEKEDMFRKNLLTPGSILINCMAVLKSIGLFQLIINIGLFLNLPKKMLSGFIQSATTRFINKLELKRVIYFKKTNLSVAD